MATLRAYYNEYDKGAAAWLRELMKDGLITPGDVDERPIQQVRADDLVGYGRVHLFAGIGAWDLALNLAGWGDAPVWTGSPPCQPFSTAGRRRRDSDGRHLWPEFARLIRAGRPGVVFGEQVPDVGWIDVVCGDLEGAGYAPWVQVRRADACGAPHSRRRTYWAASDSAGERQPGPWQRRPDAGDHQADVFREADRLVDAVRRQALPFLCRGHDGVPGRVGEVCIKGFGNAIVPQVAAAFIRAYRECVTEAAAP